MATLFSYGGKILGTAGVAPWSCDTCPCAASCTECLDNACAKCLVMQLSGAGVYADSPLYDSNGTAFIPFYCSTYSNCLVSSQLAYKDPAYCDQAHAVFSCGEPYRWSVIQSTYGATLPSLGGWYLTIGYQWDRMDQGLYDPNRPPLILKPVEPVAGCPAFGAWEVAWAPSGFDYSSLTCTVGGSSECAVCQAAWYPRGDGYYTVWVNPLNCVSNNFVWAACHCTYNVTISGVTATDPACTFNGDWGSWTKTSFGWDRYAVGSIFCTNDPHFTALYDGVYYWCLYLEFWIPYDLGRYYARLKPAGDCNLAGTYTPWAIGRPYCSYTNYGSLVLTEA